MNSELMQDLVVLIPMAVLFFMSFVPLIIKVFKGTLLSLNLSTPRAASSATSVIEKAT